MNYVTRSCLLLSEISDSAMKYSKSRDIGLVKDRTQKGRRMEDEREDSLFEEREWLEMDVRGTHGLTRSLFRGGRQVIWEGRG